MCIRDRIVSVDADARTGARSDSLFHTLQGRAVIILTRKYGDDTSITKLHYCDKQAAPVLPFLQL